MDYHLAKNQRRKNLFTKQEKGRQKFGKKEGSIGKGGSGSGGGKQNDMINVYEHTKKYCLSQFDRSTSYDDTILIDMFDLPFTKNENEMTNKYTISVVNMDTILAAIELCKEGLKPAVLNMASEYKPGGGVASGKTAQEECIFRRTNAFMTIPVDWYPLDAVKDLIYSKKVVIVKNDDDFDILPMSSQFEISLITLPGIRKPKLHFGNYSSEDRQIMSDKIESIFKVAILNNVDSLVLGALGCGVFNNPPQEVANIFKGMINNYGKYFKKIVFAVLAKEGDYKSEANFKIFSSTLSSVTSTFTGTQPTATTSITEPTRTQPSDTTSSIPSAQSSTITL